MLEEIRKLRLSEELLTKKYTGTSPLVLSKKFDVVEKYNIDNSDLEDWLYLHDRQYNIFYISEFLVKLLNNTECCDKPDLYGYSLYDRVSKEVAKEKVTSEEAVEFLKNFKCNKT